jgi:hypothetical protein
MDLEKLAQIKEALMEYKHAKGVSEALSLNIKEVAHYIQVGKLNRCRGNCTCKGML